MNGDRQLQETLKWLAGPVDRSGVWAGIEARAGDRRQLFAPKPRSARRVAVFASIAVVLVTAITVGSLEAVNHLGNDQPVVVINDDTAGMAPGSTGQTTQTAASGAQGGQWERLPLPTSEGGPVGPLVMDPNNPAILYVSTSEGLFKSTDGAGSWNQLPTIPPTDLGGVLLVADPNSPSTIYVAYTSFSEADNAATSHLLRSDDGGLTWMDLNEAGAPRMGSTSSGPWLDTTTTPSTIYMYDDTGDVWRSTDRGTTWTRLSFAEGQQAFSLANIRSPQPRPAAAQEAVDAFLASSGDDMHLTDSDTGVVVSIDAGDILVDPVRPSTFYVASPDGVYRSTDGGRSWRKAITGLGLVDRAVNSVLVDPNSPSTLYATTNAGIFRSTDGGTEWELILEGGGIQGFGNSVLLAPSIPTRLYARTSAGLFRSDDGGTNWNQLNDPPGYSDGLIQLVWVVADQPDTVFAIAEEVYYGPFYLYRSIDAGDTWQRTDLGVGPGYFGPVVVADPQHPLTIYAYGNKGDSSPHMFKSTDAGANWTQTDLDPKEWDTPDPNVVAVVSLAVDPYNPGTIWAIQNDLSDDDDGQSKSVIRRSNDDGATWETVKLDGLEQWIMWLLFDQRSPNTLYAWSGSDNPWEGTVYRSTDGGVSWENIGRNIPTGYLPVLVPNPALAPDPAPGGALYAATEGGLFKWVPSDR